MYYIYSIYEDDIITCSGVGVAGLLLSSLGQTTCTLNHILQLRELQRERGDIIYER